MTTRYLSAQRISWKAVLTVLVFSFSVFVTTDARADSPAKVDPDLQQWFHQLRQNGNSATRLPVIVQFKQVPSKERFAGLAAKHGGGRALELVRGGAFQMTEDEVTALANDADVDYITLDRVVQSANDYYEFTVGGDFADNPTYDGTGIGVAVIDSGVNDDSDLHDPLYGHERIVYNQSFVPGTDASDLYGHGTHVAGIIGGTGAQSGGANNPSAIYGVARNANIINLKVLDQNGSGLDSYVIAAIQRAIALKNTYNIRVINLSLGRPFYQSYKTDPLCQAAELAWQAGIVVVVAAGNGGRNNVSGISGYGTITAPGNDPYVITVGAIRSDNLIATYSSKGPSLIDHVVKPDLVAPGNQINSLLSQGSTLDRTYASNEVSNTVYGTQYLPRLYFTLSGTSMATPVVSGAAAILLQKYPTLTPDAVKARLMKTARKNFPAYSSTYDPSTGTTYNEQYDIFTVGTGYLNIPAALANTDVVSGSALSPIAVPNTNGSITIQNISGTSVVWGTSIVWGTSVVWGNTLLSGTSICWGSSVVWGTSTVDGYSVVWGTSMSVVWGTGGNVSDAATGPASILGAGDPVQ